jgi:hypothetical protein
MEATEQDHRSWLGRTADRAADTIIGNGQAAMLSAAGRRMRSAEVPRRTHAAQTELRGPVDDRDEPRGVARDEPPPGTPPSRLLFLRR